MALHGTPKAGSGNLPAPVAASAGQNGVKRRSHLLQRQEEEAIGTLYRLSNRPISPRSQVEQEKRIRREIANSNERRRMQSINTGFNSLKTMLPKHEGEKLSKAAILQHTAEYIYVLEQDKTRLLQEICVLKRIPPEEMEEATAKKRIKLEAERKPMEICNSDLSDEGIHCQDSSPKDNQSISSGAENELSSDELRTELVQVRHTLSRERRLRMSLEDQVRALEGQLYPERIKEIANQVQLQFQGHIRDDHINMCSDETVTAVSSVVSDEVVAETIEIETHSCPGSPVIHHPTTIVIQQPMGEQVIVEATEHEDDEGEQIHDLTARSSTGSASKSGGKNSKSGQAAIALPIDVPFIGEDETEGQITLHIINSTAESTTYEATTSSTSSTSRQNLDTIVEAIRHLEGDHLFRDDSDGGPQTVVLKQMKGGDGENDDKTLRTVVTVSPHQLGAAIRQQVIQCMPLQPRPGVIVANHA